MTRVAPGAMAPRVRSTANFRWASRVMTSRARGVAMSAAFTAAHAQASASTLFPGADEAHGAAAAGVDDGDRDGSADRAAQEVAHAERAEHRDVATVDGNDARAAEETRARR